MTTWKEWIDNLHPIADGLVDGVYVSIVLKRYEVLRVSLYHPEIDGDRRVVQTPSRKFDDKVAQYSRITRDTGMVRVITVTGKRKFMLEPGGASMEWMAAEEGVSLRELMWAIRDGVVWRRIAKRVKAEKNMDVLLEAQEDELELLVTEAETETDRFRTERRAVAGERLRRRGT